MGEATTNALGSTHKQETGLKGNGRRQLVPVKALLADVLAIADRELPVAPVVGRNVNPCAHDASLLVRLLRLARQPLKVAVWEMA